MATIKKCPSCGDLINSISLVCQSCGYVANSSVVEGESVKNLHDSIALLENLIVEVKSLPKVSSVNVIMKCFLIAITGGIYLFFLKKNDKVTSLDSIAAKFEKEERLIKTYYGDDKKILSLLAELNAEISSSIATHKKSNVIAYGIVVIVFVGMYIRGNYF